MKPVLSQRDKVMRPTALLLAASMTVPTLVGCGGGGGASQVNNPGMGGPPPGMQAQRPGMSTKQKVVLLAGAAALYYMYRKSQNKPNNGTANGRYFLSKNGRVYYRDLKTGQFQYVTPPRQPIQVPADEAQEYSGYSGYNNSQTGRGFGGYGSGGGVPSPVM